MRNPIKKPFMTHPFWHSSRRKPFVLASVTLLLTAGTFALVSYVDDVLAAPVDGVQTLIFLRHAEKPEGGLGQLTCQGLNRAIDLATLLPQRYGNANYVFAADPSRQVAEGDNNDAYSYVRPLMTINPSAIKLGLPINLTFSANDTRALAKELAGNKYRNATVYTAWSNGYLPDLINNVAGKALDKKTTLIDDWPSSDFDSLYVLTVTRKDGKTTLVSRVEKQGLNNGTRDCPS